MAAREKKEKKNVKCLSEQIIKSVDLVISIISFVRRARARMFVCAEKRRTSNIFACIAAEKSKTEVERRANGMSEIKESIEEEIKSNAAKK